MPPCYLAIENKGQGQIWLEAYWGESIWWVNKQTLKIECISCIGVFLSRQKKHMHILYKHTNQHVYNACAMPIISSRTPLVLRAQYIVLIIIDEEYKSSSGSIFQLHKNLHLLPKLTLLHPSDCAWPFALPCTIIANLVSSYKAINKYSLSIMWQSKQTYII